LPFHSRQLELALGHGNLEQEARRARYRYFRELIRSGIVHKIALGHTRSDQAETVLFRLLRGSGSAGLAGIRPVTDSGLIRPLLHVTRVQVEGWLNERGIEWREDETNTELRFDRNRIRHQLIPQLTAEWNPELVETLARTADWAFEEEQYWRQELPRLGTDWVRFVKDAAVIDAGRLNGLPVAAGRRLIREIVERVKDDLRGVGFEHVEAVRHLAALPEGAGRVQIAGVEVLRSFNWLRFAKSGDAAAMLDRKWQVCVTAPGRYVIPCSTQDGFSTSAFELNLFCYNGVYNRDVNALDFEKVGDGPLVIRNWRSGDQYQRLGHSGSEKVKKFFQENRIPLWERQSWPIITIGGLIAWARQFGPATQFAVDEGTRTVLGIHEILEKA
jgi:tRNA(Ile)-lysidine synthase